jgi:hypothetical protein
MTMQNVPSTSKSPATMCTEDGCREVAAFTYVWPWGESGACCHGHRLHVAQRSQNLGRGDVQFVAIDPHFKPPITRDERTLLIAGKMSAEEETRQAIARGAELYASNQKLVTEGRRLAAEKEQVVAEHIATKKLLDRALSERDEARTAAGRAQAEVERLKLLLPTDPTPRG